MPNPFNPRTTIFFSLPTAAQVTLRVFDLAGRPVVTLLDREIRGSGRYDVVWDGPDAAGRPAPTGTYICRVEADSRTGTTRMTLVK